MTSPIIIQNAQLQSFNRREWSPTDLFVGGEQGMWYDPSDLTVEKVAWRRNLLTYSENFENTAWTKINSSILSNLALYSQDFDNVAWTKINATVTANTTTAPDGTTTADTMTTSGTAAIQRVYQLISLTGISTFSVYVKANTAQFVQILQSTDGNAFANFDVGTGVVGTSGSNATSSITSVGSGWYRCQMSATITTAGNWMIYIAPSANAGYGNAFTATVASLFLWGAQLVPGSTAQTYTRTLARSAPIPFADPFGGTVANKLVENTANDVHTVSLTPTILPSRVMTMSVYAKAAERSWFYILSLGRTPTDAPSTSNMWFDLANGTIGGTVDPECTASITAVGGGWYRCAITTTSTGLSTSSAREMRIGLATTDSIQTYSGDGTSGVLIFGAQMEQASTASAYQRITDFNGDFLAAFPTHAMYQDNVGSTPVTVLGQSVGLVLDKRQGALTNLGPELVTNPGPNFTTTTGWSAYDANAALSVGGGTLILTTTATSYGQQSFTTVVGQTYRVSGSIVSAASPGGGFWGIRKSDNAAVTTNVVNIYTSNLTSGGPVNFSGFFVATATTTFINMQVNGAGSMTLANISTRLVPGNHIVQSTIGSRPTLQARKNLLKSTEQFDTGDWVKGTGVTASANLDTAPDGTLTADYVAWSAVGPGSFLRGYPVITSGSTYTYSVYARMISGSATFTMDFGNTGYSPAFTPTSTWQRFAYTRAYEGTNQWADIEVSAPCTMSLWGAQVELSNTTSSYQRVTTDTDYADVGVSRALQFDGLDDWMATPVNVDFSRTDKVTAFTGLFKASDAFTGTVFDLNGLPETNSFMLRAPSGNTSPNYNWRSGGSLAAVSATAITFAAPITNVISCIGNIAGDSAIIRVNGTEAASNTADQGTGNYSNLPIYVGRRQGSSLPFNGRLHQLLINGRQFSGDEITRTEQWIASRTGVTL